MAYWMMMLLAIGAVLALGLLFILLIVALDDEAQEDPSTLPREPRWTSVI